MSKLAAHKKFSNEVILREEKRVVPLCLLFTIHVLYISLRI